MTDFFLVLTGQQIRHGAARKVCSVLFEITVRFVMCLLSRRVVHIDKKEAYMWNKALQTCCWSCFKFSFFTCIICKATWQDNEVVYPANCQNYVWSSLCSGFIPETPSTELSKNVVSIISVKIHMEQFILVKKRYCLLENFPEISLQMVSAFGVTNNSL